jgi:hypothetical protein
MMRHRSVSKTPHFFNRLWGVWVLTTEADLDETAPKAYGGSPLGHGRGWQLPASFQAVHRNIGRHTAGPVREDRSAHPFDGDAQRVQVVLGDLFQGRAGDVYTALAGGLHHSRGDVDVDTQPVRSDPLRAPGVDTDSHRGCIAFHFN